MVYEKVKKNKCKCFYSGIFMDCSMPIMDGYQASSILVAKMQKKEIPTIPIVACTAHALDEDMEKCKKHGMTLYMVKPI